MMSLARNRFANARLRNAVDSSGLVDRLVDGQLHARANALNPARIRSTCCSADAPSGPASV